MNTLKVEAYRGYKVETAYTRLGTVPIIVQMSDKEVDDWSRMGLRKYKDEEPKQEQPKRIEEDKPKPTSVPEPSAMLFELEKIDKLEQKPKQVQKPKPKATKQDESQIKIDLFE
jgi:hypothetical protein